MFSFLGKLFTGSAMTSIEKIATEWIETDAEQAEAKTVMIKALDPNGQMRRQLSRDVTRMYMVYLFTSLFLLAVEFTCAFFNFDVNTEALAVATQKMTELFIPITSLFGVIVSASFGVNYANIKSKS